MMVGIGKVVRRIYREMQRHYWSFKILIWLREQGIAEKIKFYFNNYSRDKQMRGTPTDEMKNSEVFFDLNQKRVDAMLELLSDEKSKMVWKGAVNNRTKKLPIPSGFYSEHDQYFCRDIIKVEKDEVFIDGGAYRGDTIQSFMNICKKEKVSYKKIIAFEPDCSIFNLLSKFYGEKKNIFLINKGLSKKVDTLSFVESEGGASKIVESEVSTYQIPVVNIDAVPECREATFIKMDIEGAEMDALCGAQETIRRNRPKLAICIYHSNEDMIRIIEYIHSLVPEYRLYVRHHTRSSTETVVYAVV